MTNRTSRLAGIVALGVGAAFVSGAFGGTTRGGSGTAVRLTEFEQRAYIAGDPPPVTWEAGKLCINPPDQATQNASECNKTPNTTCAIANGYCMQQKKVTACADSKTYKFPLECVTQDTKKECAKDPNGTEVPCYEYGECVCRLDATGNWVCKGGVDTYNIKPCMVK